MHRIQNRQNLGGMTLSYFGYPLEMWAQLRLMHVARGGSVDVTFANLKDQRSNERNAVWQAPGHSHATLAIGNVGSETLNAELRFSTGELESVQVTPFGTALVRRKASAREERAEAVTVTTSQGLNLVLAGLISTEDGAYTSSIRFHDTLNAAQPNLYATRFRLQGVEPHMIVRNTSAQEITVTPRFLPAPSNNERFIDLPVLNLQPSEIASIDLSPLERAVSGDTDFDAVSVQLLNTGTPGSLIGALNGVDQGTGMVYDVPLRDIGGLRTSTGSYPWRLDGDMSTIASLTNVAPFSSEFVVQINYPGGHYLLDPQKLAAGGTATFDLRKIRDQQIPDRTGNVIPRSVTGGQFRWFIHGAGSGRLIGRAEMLSRSRTISSSYSCNDPCPPQMSNVWLDPSVLELLVGEEGGQTALEVDSDSYGNLMGPFSPWVAWWSCSDPSVVSMEDEGTYADFTGVADGFASTAATIYYQTYGWDGLNCYYNGLGQTDANGEAQVRCAVPTNFHQVGPGDDNQGVLHFHYEWSSSTGKISDLSQCTIGEIVTYPGANPYPWPKPPFDSNSNNPTVHDYSASATGALGDNHLGPDGGWVTPYQAASFTATQYYRYKCPCANNGEYVNVMGPLSIVRTVSQNQNGSWKYTVTKSGSSAVINPLP